MIFRITSEAFSMLSSGTYSSLPWKLCPPAKILGQGSPMKDRFLDEQAIAMALLDNEAKAEIPENIRLGANRQLPMYSQISKVEIVDRPFEKTPKMSIRRFLYK